MDAAKRSAEQRKLVWSGCQTVLGWVGLIALAALGYLALGMFSRGVASGPGVIVFVDFKSLKDGAFWCGLAGGIFFFCLLAAAKSTRGFLMVCITFLAAAGFTIWGLYARVAAIAFPGDAVELRYLWPRPAVRLDPREITSVQYEESVCLSDWSAFDYALDLRTGQRRYVSFADASLDDMRRTIRQIQEMQERGTANGRE